MALSERDRRALIMGAAVLVLLAVYIKGIRPLSAWHDGLVTVHAADAHSVDRILADQDKAARWKKQIEKREPEVGELMPPAVYSEQITRLTEQILAAAGKSGVELKESTPSAATSWPEDPALQQSAPAAQEGAR